MILNRSLGIVCILALTVNVAQGQRGWGGRGRGGDFADQYKKAQEMEESGLSPGGGIGGGIGGGLEDLSSLAGLLGGADPSVLMNLFQNMDMTQMMSAMLGDVDVMQIARELADQAGDIDKFVDEFVDEVLNEFDKPEYQDMYSDPTLLISNLRENEVFSNVPNWDGIVDNFVQSPDFQEAMINPTKFKAKVDEVLGHIKVMLRKIRELNTEDFRNMIIGFGKNLDQIVKDPSQMFAEIDKVMNSPEIQKLMSDPAFLESLVKAQEMMMKAGGTGGANPAGFADILNNMGGGGGGGGGAPRTRRSEF